MGEGAGGWGTLPEADRSIAVNRKALHDYEALSSLGVPTQLIIYPGEKHGIMRPSYQKDRIERYLAWYAKYLKSGQSTAGAN